MTRNTFSNVDAAPLRLLTTLRHERYTRSLAAIGHRWDVIAGDSWLREPWRAARALPPNATAVSAATARQRLARGDYDAVVCHGLDELEQLSGFTPAAVVLHSTLEADRLFGLTPSAWRRRAATALDEARCVFVGDDVQESWQLSGRVIAPAVEEDDAESRADVASALRIDTGDGDRAVLTGGTPLDEMLRGLPCTVAAADAPRHELYASHRALVTAPRAPWELGAPLPMLDAMAAGMAVITAAHPYSPIVHGVNGLIGTSAAEIRGHVLELLGDRELALALGRQARAFTREHFGAARFARAWQELLGAMVDVHDARRSLPLAS